MENVGFLKDKPKALYVFRVVTKGHIYLLSARSQALKQDWMKARKALALALRLGSHKKLLISDLVSYGQTPTLPMSWLQDVTLV